MKLPRITNLICAILWTITFGAVAISMFTGNSLDPWVALIASGECALLFLEDFFDTFNKN